MLEIEPAKHKLYTVYVGETMYYLKTHVEDRVSTRTYYNSKYQKVLTMVSSEPTQQRGETGSNHLG